jgi:hypothetical protein
MNSEYEKETLKIIESKKLSHKNLRIITMIILWNFRSFLLKFNSKIVNILVKIITKMNDSMHQLPELIHYNFDENRWEKNCK